MTGWWRWLYYNVGWEYKPTETTEKIKRDRHEVLTQIKSYGNNIKKILLKEEGEVRASTPRASTPTIDVGILDNYNDFTDGTPRGLVGFDALASTECDRNLPIDNIRDYTRLFEGFEIETKKKRRRKRNKSNNFNF
jgi:hypothetical protein